jgi:HTH-type transcriptional regulator / antitoxin HipB
VHEAYDAADLGLAIRALRRDRGWTQATLASWLGVTRQTVVSLEHGGPVSLEMAMLAIAMLGSKAVIVPKSQRIPDAT